MSGGVAALGVAALLAASALFAYLNGAERVTLRLGFTTLYRIPLLYLVFGAMLLGMLIMLVAGVHADLRVRRFLRERLAEEERQEKVRAVDRSQQDLFDQEGR